MSENLRLDQVGIFGGDEVGLSVSCCFCAGEPLSVELVYISADLALALIFCYEQQFQALVQAIIAARPPAEQVRPPFLSDLEIHHFSRTFWGRADSRLCAFARAIPWPQI